MGKGKKKNTAKTGDKALYNARGHLAEQEAKKKDNDDMYNEVDRYNNAKDELQDDMLNFGQKEESDEEGVQNDVEGVFDLGLDGSEEESDSDDSGADADSDDEESTSRKPLQNDDDDDDDDSSVEGFDEAADPDVLNWGKKKNAYYNGDTADMEIGQEMEDAEQEEIGAQEVLQARLEGMTEGDFMLDEEDDSEEEDLDEKDSEEIETMAGENHSAKRRKLSKLSKKEKVKLMTKNHPELLPLVSHFRDEAIRPCAEKTSVVVNALLQSDENAEVRFTILLRCIFAFMID